MKIDLEIPCTTRGVRYNGRMFICTSNLEKLFEGDWTNRDFVACLKRATPKSRRPRRDALKVKISYNFAGKGLVVEGPDGRFTEELLTSEADKYIRDNNLELTEQWVWVEYVE